MSGGPYYKQKFIWQKKWSIYKRVNAGGDRQMADGMSEAFAAKVVRLLNADEAGQPRRSQDYALLDHPVETLD